MGHPPLVITSQERFTHSIEDLGGMSRQRVLPQQDGEPIVGGIGPHLDRAAGSRVGYFVDYCGLLDMRAVECPAQEGIGQGGPVPEHSAK
jgi:hypothetical protein